MGLFDGPEPLALIQSPLLCFYLRLLHLLLVLLVGTVWSEHQRLESTAQGAPVLSCLGRLLSLIPEFLIILDQELLWGILSAFN